jgi:ribosomal protein L24E
MRGTKRSSVRVGAALVFVASMFAAALATAPLAGAAPATNGYRLLGGDGGVFPFGAPFLGAAASDPSRCPSNVTDRNEPNGTCWSIASTPDGNGYWILNGDTGVIYPYGNAGFFGDPAQQFAGIGREFVPNGLTIVSTRSGNGYWVLEAGLSDTGTVHHFGDAQFFGDTTTIAAQTNQGFAGVPVALAAAPDGNGYWEVHSDGGVFAFGSAKFHGSMAGRPLAGAIVGIAPAADGNGYWLVAADGGVFAFGSATFAGSMHGRALRAPVVGMARNPAGNG